MSRPTRWPGSSRPVRACAAALLALGLLASCGSEGSGEGDDDARASQRGDLRGDMAMLDAASFASTSVAGRDLVPGTELILSFEEDALAVSGGCNTVFGAYDVTDGVLSWTSGPATTLIACPDDEAAQDQWFTDLLGQGVAATTDGVDLRLEADDVTLVLERKPASALDELLGRTWSVVGTLSDGSTSRLPSRVRTPRLVVGEDGLARLDTGCNTGRTRVQVDRVSITFAPPTVTRVACREPDRTIERIVLSVVDGRSEYLTFNGWMLLVVRAGRGLVFEVV